jgi:hypothetical protein
MLIRPLATIICISNGSYKWAIFWAVMCMININYYK